MIRSYDHDDIKVKFIMKVKHFEKVKVNTDVKIEGIGMQKTVQTK